MTTPASPRPHKVTLACLIAGMGSALVLITVFAELQNWGSIEVREQVEDAIASTPFIDAGVDIDQVLGWLRLVLMGVAAAAVAGVLLAIWTAKAHRGARIALSILAGVAALGFLATGLVGLLPAGMAVACILYLWSKESRAWFSGKEVPSTPSPRAAPSAESGTPPLSADERRPGSSGIDGESEDALPVTQPPLDGPRPSERPFGTPPQSHQGASPQGAQSQRAYGVRRPRSIVIAVVVTSVMAGLVGLVSGANALLYLLSPSEYTQLLLEQPMLQEQRILEQLGMSGSELSRLIFIGAVVCAVLAAAAIGTALLMLRRIPAARIGFTVVTGLAIALSVIAFPLGLIWAAGEIFVLVQVYRVDANAWFAARN